MSPQFDPFPTGAPDDAVQAIWRYLSGISDITSLLGYSDDGTPFIYNGSTDRSYHDMAGTSACAVMVSSAGSWAGPNTDNTAQFPRICVQVWSDAPRDSSNNVTSPTENRTRANAVWQQINGRLHVPFTKVIVNTGTLLIYSSTSTGSLTWRNDPQNDNVGVLTGFFGLSIIVGGIDP